MELNELKTKLKELEDNTNKTISELKAEIEKKEKELENKSKVWKPKIDESYYYICVDGNVDITAWLNTYGDINRYILGNCFKTREEAIKESDKRILLTKLEIWALEHNEEDIDWSDIFQNKYCIYYNHADNELGIESYSNDQYSQLPYFTSRELAKQFIDIFGERLIELVFNK